MIEQDNKTEKCRLSNLCRSSSNIISGIKESSETYKIFYEMAKKDALRWSNYTMQCFLIGAVFNPMHILVVSLSILFTVQSLLNPGTIPTYFQLPILILFYLGISLVSIFLSLITKRKVIKPIIADTFENKDRRWVWLLFFAALFFSALSLIGSAIAAYADEKIKGLLEFSVNF